MEKKCSRCHATKPTSVFAVERKARDGLQRWCRQCATDYDRDRRSARRSGAVPLRSVAEKACLRCGVTKIARAFSKNMARVDGLDSVCRACKRAGRPRFQPKPPFPLSDLDIGYIAAMIDGEGHIRLRPHSGQMGAGVEVTNTHRGMLEWLRDTLGGTIQNHRAASVRHKQTWRWAAGPRLTLRILETVGHAMKIKRRHAELLLAFYSAIPAHREYGYSALTLETMSPEMRTLLNELRLLNRRGPPE